MLKSLYDVVETCHLMINYQKGPWSPVIVFSLDITHYPLFSLEYLYSGLSSPVSSQWYEGLQLGSPPAPIPPQNKEKAQPPLLGPRSAAGAPSVCPVITITITRSRRRTIQRR